MVNLWLQIELIRVNWDTNDFIGFFVNEIKKESS